MSKPHKKSKKRKHKEVIEDSVDVAPDVEVIEKQPTKRLRPEETEYLDPDKHFVKVDLEYEQFIYTFWDSCAVPETGVVSYKLSEDRKQLIGDHRKNLRVKYVGSEFQLKDKKYRVAVEDSEGKVEYVPIRLFRMRPVVDLVPRSGPNDAPESELSKHEQLFQLNEKFGSKQAKRALDQKKKFNLSFDQDDVQKISEMDVASSDKAVNGDAEKTDSPDKSKSKEKQPISASLSDIIPTRNAAATSVKEVYSYSELINDITESWVINYIKEMKADDYIVNEELKKKCKKSLEMRTKVICVYTDLLLQVVSLKHAQLNRKNVLDSITHLELKDFLTTKYLENSSSNSSGKSRIKWTLSDKNKDRIFASIVILLLMLHDYKAIPLTDLTKKYQLPGTRITKIVTVVGCYVEKTPKSGQCIVFKLPLNQLKNPMMRGRSKV